MIVDRDLGASIRKLHTFSLFMDHRIEFVTLQQNSETGSSLQRKYLDYHCCIENHQILQTNSLNN